MPSEEIRALNPVFWDFVDVVSDRVQAEGGKRDRTARGAQWVIEDVLWPQSANGTRAITDEMIEAAWHREIDTFGPPSRGR